MARLAVIAIGRGLYLHGFVEKPAEPQILALKRSQRLGRRQPRGREACVPLLPTLHSSSIQICR